MNTVDLHVYDAEAEDPLDSVLAGMASFGRSGVVVRDGNRYRLFLIGDIAAARKRGAASIQELAGGDAVEPVGEAGTQATIDAKPYRYERMSYDTALSGTASDRNPEYTARGRELPTVRILSRHEGLRAALNLTDAYHCDGTGDDYFPSTEHPNVSAGDVCPRWPVCTRAGGGKPRVNVI